jgi:hypothetical protein
MIRSTSRLLNAALISFISWGVGPVVMRFLQAAFEPLATLDYTGSPEG